MNPADPPLPLDPAVPAPPITVAPTSGPPITAPPVTAPTAAPLDARIGAALARAAQLLAAGQYYETHEVLEHVWLDCRGHDRAALGGLILLAAALHKRRRQQHPRAARVLYARALRNLAPLDDRWRSIDLRAMERQTLAALEDPTLPTPLLGSSAPAVGRQPGESQQLR